LALDEIRVVNSSMIEPLKLAVDKHEPPSEWAREPVAASGT
jgi:hypothetical protein